MTLRKMITMRKGIMMRRSDLPAEKRASKAKAIKTMMKTRLGVGRTAIRYLIMAVRTMCPQRRDSS